MTLFVWQASLHSLMRQSSTFRSSSTMIVSQSAYYKLVHHFHLATDTFIGPCLRGFAKVVALIAPWHAVYAAFATDGRSCVTMMEIASDLQGAWSHIKRQTQCSEPTFPTKAARRRKKTWSSTFTTNKSHDSCERNRILDEN